METPDGLIERDDLIETLAAHEIHVTPTMLLRWHDRWILPQPVRKGRGQGRGSRSYYPAFALQLAGFIAIALKVSRDLDGAGWDAWTIGFPLTPFARDYLLEVAETELRDARKLSAFLRKEGKGAAKKRRALAREVGSKSPTLSVLPGDRVLAALSGFVDIELGVWRAESAHDPRVQAIGTGLNHAVADWIDQEATGGRLDAANPIVEYLVAHDVPDSAIADGAAASSVSQSLPILIRWLKAVSDTELEAFRNTAMAFIRQCGAFSGSDEPLGMTPGGFLRFLRIRALDAGMPSLWNAGIDAILEMDQGAPIVPGNVESPDGQPTGSS